MEVITSGRFPRVSAFIVEAQHLDETAPIRAAIELILDGIAARLDALIPRLIATLEQTSEPANTIER